MAPKVPVFILLLCLVLLPIFSANPALRAKRDAKEEEVTTAEPIKSTENLSTDKPSTEENKESKNKNPSKGLFEGMNTSAQKIMENVGQVFNVKGSPNIDTNTTSWLNNIPFFG